MLIRLGRLTGRALSAVLSCRLAARDGRILTARNGRALAWR